MHKLKIGFASVAFALSAAGNAQTPTTLNAGQTLDAVSACRKIEDKTARLDCYDRNVAAMASAHDRRDFIVVDRGEARKTRQAFFGLALPSIHLFGRDDKQSEDVSEIETTVEAVAPTGYNLFTLTLGDNSVWQTTDTVPFPPAPGGKITIKRGGVGGFRARLSGQIMPVKRLR